jgi:starch synthase (maltosyl-transferring)
VPLPKTTQPPARIQIQAIEPIVDCGRYAVKRTVGDRVDVFATIFKDGHDTLAGAVRLRRPGERNWQEVPLQAFGNDRWGGSFVVDRPGRWEFTVELSEGAVLLGRDAVTVEEGLAAEAGDRDGLVTSAPLEVDVDRVLARFGSWYELFPRSWGGFRGVAEVLPQVAQLGFDVVYLPPVHPIGRTNRKGPNNTLTPGPGDPGSPWAIGSEEGGHDAIHPDLGTWDDFDAMVAAAKSAGIELALDFAIQCSPDHPWLKEHPEWFYRRPDGTLKYAENPPKKYQDIYNVNFDSEDWRGLWQALLDVVLGWVERGITVFRVDNPHTKPTAFWEWLIREVRASHPDVIFLAEAFTRPAVMTTLAKLGFAQSYTYFTWKNSKAELAEYMQQLVAWSQFYRPNAFANTPDILHEYLQHGGPPAFRARLVLAATLSPTYGIYSGFESFENVPVRAGSEEYLDSEKYEARKRSLDGPLLPLVGALNRARRAEPALQVVDNLRWLETENDALVGYAKDDVVCVVNVDPHLSQAGACVIPVALRFPPAFPVRDLVTGDTFTWRAGRNYVELPPGGSHVLKVGA